MHHDATSSGREGSPRLRLHRYAHGVFLWPSNVETGGTLALTSAQLSMLIDGVDWARRSGSGAPRWRDDRCGRLTQQAWGSVTRCPSHLTLPSPSPSISPPSPTIPNP